MHLRIQRFPGFNFIAVCALLCLGCARISEDLPETVPVTGTVTYQSKPVPGANVMFYPEEGRKPAVGTTDENGVYSLTTFEKGDGAIPGTHTVTVTAYDSTDQGASMASLVPEKYASPTASPLQVTVEQGSNEIPLELSN